MIVRIGKQRRRAFRLGLYGWFVLDQCKADIQDAARRRDIVCVVNTIKSYLRAATGYDFDLSSAPWYDVAKAIDDLERLNTPKLKLALFESASADRKQQLLVWDYVGRSWYLWLNFLAKAYGWTIEYIKNLDLDDGLALIQECLVDEQLQREWQWQLTEIAFPYNPTTKKSEFHPLPRPSWMVPKVVIKRIKIPQSLLPVGNVVDVGGMYAKFSTKH